MAEVLSPKADTKSQRNEQTAANRASSLTRSLLFKYYIHDSVTALRFQLIGDLRSANLGELSGSWDTARTTLNGRRFSLDVSQLYSSDDEARRWLLEMRNAGAEFHPANYLDSSAVVTPHLAPDHVCSVRLSIVGRVIGLFRS